MADDAHDMSLMTLIIDGVAHGLAVYGETLVLPSINLVPALQGAVQMLGIDADKNIPEDGLAGYDVTAVFATATETLPGLLAKTFRPIGDGFISAHPTQDGPGGNSQNRGQWMPPSLGAAGIGNSLKKEGRDCI